MAPAKEILIVDDEVGIRELLSEILQDEGYRVSLAENATAARAYRARERPALVLLDIWMPDTDGVTLLREWAASGQLTMPVIMMSGHGTIETAVEATKIGAFDFLEKPVGLQKLLGTVARALKIALAREPRRVSLASIGTSAAMRDVERQIEQLLAARKPVLILGEPGAGHDVAARALHAPDTPRVVLPNGSRLASNPLAILEEARDGTLYCSEIGQYAKVEQRGLAFLLPKLDKANVTLVCTSTEPLGNMAAENKFDPALLAALSTGAVLLPPLRARREDVLQLARAFLLRFNRELNRQTPVTGFEPGAEELLAAYSWPGNVRELENAIERAVLLAEGNLVQVQNLPERVWSSPRSSERSAPSAEVSSQEDLSLKRAMRSLEERYIRAALRRTRGNRTRASEMLEISHRALLYKIKEYGIDADAEGELG